MQDLFAMSALQITTQLVKLEAGHESNSEDLEKQIENMSQQIDAVLSQ